MLKQLEKDYINENTNGKGLKNKIKELFIDNARVAAQIDKNTSAVAWYNKSFVKHQISNIYSKGGSDFRKIVYGIEMNVFFCKSSHYIAN